ncbi:MAG TPA: hypothetical protein VFO76_01470 [Candidatus Kapabacteria bacterium]|nr:hypothetical protein [Candidatus Kapabacteria bacterium]
MKTTISFFTVISVLIISNVTYAHQQKSAHSTVTTNQAAQIATATVSKVKDFFTPHVDAETLFPMALQPLESLDQSAK